MQELRLTPTRWAQFPHIADVRPITESEEAMLLEVRAILEKYGALDRFGITLIHRHFSLEEGEIAVEKTIENERKQVIEVMREQDLDPAGNSITTQWVFEAGRPGMICRVECNYQDYSHRRGHASISS